MTNQMNFITAKTSQQVAFCKDVLFAFRTNLEEDTYIDKVIKMIEDERFHLVNIPTDDQSMAAAFIGYRVIHYALPNDDNVSNDIGHKAIRLTENCFICGDHLLNGSINAVMKSGRLAAEAICPAGFFISPKERAIAIMIEYEVRKRSIKRNTGDFPQY